MVSKPVFRTIVTEQRKEFQSLEGTVPRTLFPIIKSYAGASAFVLKGIRRCGKSTLFKQLINARFDNNFLYFDFDDERIINFKTDDFQPLMETLIEAFGNKKAIFFDEIQNVMGWELFINRMLRQKYHVFITGSNANLLSKELGTHLTGRHVDIELYPFSFIEFLTARKIALPRKGFYSTEQRAVFSKSFKEYLSKGGMPEVVVYANEEVLAKVLNDIIQKDIIERYKIRKPSEIKTVLKFLTSNISNPFTFRSIINNFNIKSVDTVQKYLEYAEEAYLLFTVRKFERKKKKLDKNPRKVYCIDNGIVVKNSPAINEKMGALLENVVAVQLKRTGKEFYYYSNKRSEADFVVPAEKTAIQVCYELDDRNKEREIKGLTEAMEEINADTGFLLTLEQEEELTIKGKKIVIQPVWQWLIENELSE